MEKQGKHPASAGLLLALSWGIVLVLVGPLSGWEAARALLMGGLSGTPQMTLAALAALPVGAWLGALPARIRRHRAHEHGEKSTARGCIGGLIGGVVLALAAGLAGADFTELAMLGTVQGAVSGLAFLGIAAAAAVLTAVLRGRKHRE